MKNNKTRMLARLLLFVGLIGIVCSADAMGLRSFVALPVEKGGAVLRLTIEHDEDINITKLITSGAYGFSSKQALLVGLPYRLSPTGDNRQGDLSALYRHIVWQDDSFSGTNRLGLLAGVVVPGVSERDAAAQAGFIFTHFKNKHELDFDVVYQSGLGERDDSGRYDISWQYRLAPDERPEWGIVPELNSVLELNGRWNEGMKISHQLTLGLQWVQQAWVIDGGVIKELNNDNKYRYLLSARFHF